MRVALALEDPVDQHALQHMKFDRFMHILPTSKFIVDHFWRLAA